MYAMNYTNPERVAPAAIAIVVHLTLLYVFAVGFGVLPRVPDRDLTYVEVPKEAVKSPSELPQVVPDSMAAIHRLQIENTPPDLEIEPSVFPPTGSIEPPTAEVGEVRVQEALTNVRILSSAEPAYPLISRAREEEGTVLVKVMISPYGTALDVQVEKSSGYPRLDEAAIKAVRAWRFAPAKKGTQAIATWATVPVKFVLNLRR